MNRITKRDQLPDGTRGIFHFGHWYGKAHFSTDEEHKEYNEILRRLAAYEDTGMSPEEIQKINDNIRWANAFAPTITRERYEEICFAERDGRLVALPVKIGQTVFSTDYGYVNTLHVMRIRPLIATELFDFFPEDFGKRLFHTREEAEAAIKGGNQDV